MCRRACSEASNLSLSMSSTPSKRRAPMSSLRRRGDGVVAFSRARFRCPPCTADSPLQYLTLPRERSCAVPEEGPARTAAPSRGSAISTGEGWAVSAPSRHPGVMSQSAFNQRRFRNFPTEAHAMRGLLRISTCTSVGVG